MRPDFSLEASFRGRRSRMPRRSEAVSDRPLPPSLPLFPALHDADGPAANEPSRPEAPPRGWYVPIAGKYLLTIAFASAWMLLSIVLSLPWLRDLAGVAGWPVAIFAIGFIAWVPGFMNAFLSASILMDRRPARRVLDGYPPIAVLVACYNEETSIGDTLESLARQRYPGEMDVLVLDDGSRDGSVAIAKAAAARLNRPDFTIRVLPQGVNRGKSHVLNVGLAETTHELVITVDADSWVYDDGLRAIVERLLTDPPGTAAVAGAALARNSRVNWLTKAQEWDYFHGIAAVKRMQSMYHGTLVAQGAFSIYRRSALLEVGGLPHCVGEDIVVSWALLKAGYRVGFAEDACLFTNVPESLGQFARQRQRWSRGLIEAFQRHGDLLWKPRMSTLFIWWNLLFLPMDLAFTLIFIPGLVAALFGFYWIAGPMTLLVLPLALLWNYVIFRVQARMFRRQGLRVRRNIEGFLFYAFLYTIVLQPVCLKGYLAELLKLKKTWGTK